jgi:hypothetical protein
VSASPLHAVTRDAVDRHNLIAHERFYLKVSLCLHRRLFRPSSLPHSELNVENYHPDDQSARFAYDNSRQSALMGYDEIMMEQGEIRGSFVADELSQEDEPAPVPILHKRKGRAPGALLFVAALGAIAGGVGYLWLNFDRMVASYVAQPVPAPAVGITVETVTLKDFQIFEQRTAESMQSAVQDIAALQSDMKRLSEQLSVLASKPDRVPIVEQPATAVAPARPSVVATRKKPPIPKPAGAISVGGAPLPAAPAPDHQ